MEELNKLTGGVKEKLLRFTFKEKLCAFFFDAQKAALFILSIFLFFSALESVFRLDESGRTTLFVLLALSSAWAIYYFIIKHAVNYYKIKKTGDYRYAAKRAGFLFPEIKDDLLNALQIADGVQSPINYSAELILAAVKRIVHKVENIDLLNAINYKKAADYLYRSIPVCAAIVLLFAFTPGLRAASARIFDFNSEYIAPAKFYFYVKPGDISVTKGASLTVSAEIKGEIPRSVYLFFKSAEQSEFIVKKVVPDSLGVYSHEFISARVPFRYYFTAENIKSKEYKVEIVDKPAIKTFELTIKQPGYSRRPDILQKDNGNVSALKGSKISFSLLSSKPLKNAVLSFEDGSSVKFNLEGNKAFADYKILKSINYQIVLTDNFGNQNEFPILYNISSLEDSPPEIKMIFPNQNVSLGEDNRQPLQAKISDDYGFSSLKLNYKLSLSKYNKPQLEYTKLDIPIGSIETGVLVEKLITYIWNLSNLNFSIGDVIEYYLEVFDNDYFSGPKSERTRIFSLRIPSIDEIFKQADEKQNQLEADLSAALEEAKNLKETIQKIDAELKRDNKDVDWREKEKIETALQKFEELQKKIDDTRKNFAESKNEMNQNQLLSKETLEKYSELQELFRELSSEEMKLAMERMQNALQTMDRKQIQDAFHDFQFSEDAFQKSVERTLNLLKRVQIEQKLDELIKRSENLEKRQNELSEKLSNENISDKENREKLLEEQKAITEELKRLSEEMKKLKERMNKFDDMPNREMDKLSEEFDKEDNPELSRSAEESIQNQEKTDALKNQKNLSKNMQNMKSSLQKLQQNMQSQNQAQTFNEMTKILNNLIFLSKEQEELKNQTQKMDASSPRFNENARRQNELNSSLDRVISQMSDLSQKTFAISPEMGKSIGDAKRGMSQAIQNLQNRNAQAAANNQNSAMKSLNESATLMKGAMDQMMSGGSGGGMMSLSQQLNMLYQKQMSINNLTQALSQGTLTMEQQGQLQRIIQEQEIARKSLEQLNQELKSSGESKKLPSSLDDILKEMKEVVSDMKSERINHELTQKQERILSRLLDAQRSINDRDYENERESRAGDDFKRESPGKLILDPEKSKNKIQDELNNAIHEGFTRDFENIVRKYYENLQSKKRVE